MNMESNLLAIDWDAIGAIATFVMTIAAFITIYISVTQTNNKSD